MRRADVKAGDTKEALSSFIGDDDRQRQRQRQRYQKNPGGSK